CGTITVYSEPGHGTTFKVYLPRDTSVATEPEPLGPEQSARGAETVLLVEDEPMVRKLAARMLSSQGYEVLEAANGAEALALLDQPTTQPVSLILTDIIMPHMGGQVLVERVQQQYPHIKVLLMSGYTDDALIHQGALGNDIAFLHKPFSSVVLGRKVREVLDTSD
ncbi:MAG TPA: response regulator, partial [Roseiflexaceae bacterium]|nr:response regulator [Roseiflexaceae bacterium]